MRKHLLFTLFLLASPVFGAYKYARPVVIPASHVQGADQTNFPMAVVGTYPYLATVANGGGVTSGSGFDIIFASDSACTTKLNFERVSWNSANGRSEFHIQIPTLSHTSPNIFYLCYGNSAVTTDQSTRATWPAPYLGVWHLGDGASLNTVDSTSNGNNGTLAGTPVAAAGQLSGSALFDGASEIDIPASVSLQSPTSAVTLSAWMTPSTTSQVNVAVIAAQSYAAPNAFPFWPYYLSANDGTCPTNNIAAFWEVDTANLRHVCSDAANDSRYAVGQWYHLVFTFDGAIGRIYVNGVLTSSTTGVTGTLKYNNGLFWIGKSFKGAVDEVRVSNVVRDANWIATEYSNQLHPSQFYTIGQLLTNSSQITNVRVKPTTTQAVLRFTAPSNPSACTVAISESSSLDPLVPDVDPTIFTGANLANRDAYNQISGNTVTFVAGKRYHAYQATAGDTTRRKSRTLQADTTEFVAINCGGEEYDTSFKTATLMSGDAHSDGIPADPNNPGAPWWQDWEADTRCDVADTTCSLHGEKRRGVATTDVQTGVLMRPLVYPGDTIEPIGLSFMGHRAEAGWAVPPSWGNQTGFVDVDGSNANIYWKSGQLFDTSGAWAGKTITLWSNPYTISSCASVFVCTLTTTTAFAGQSAAFTVSNPQTATVNGSTAKLFATGVQNFDQNAAFNAGYAPYVVPSMLQFNIRALTSNASCVAGSTSDDCKLQACVSTDQVSCAPGAQIYDIPITSTSTVYTIGTGENMDVLQAPGQPLWSRDQTAILFANASCSSNRVTIAWNGDTIRPGMNINVGSIVYLNGTPYTVSNLVNDLQFDVASGPASCTSLMYSGFSVAVWKKTTSADTITVSFPNMNVWEYGDKMPQTFAGYISGFNSIPLPNGHNGSLIQVNSGSEVIDLQTGDTYPFASAQGGVTNMNNIVGSVFSYDGQGRYWMLQNQDSGQLFYTTYTGDYQRPFIRVGNGEQLTVPLWENNAGSGLPTCSSTITSRCITTTQLTQAGTGLIQLLHAFDSRYPNSTNTTLNPFQTFLFNGFEAGGTSGEVLSITLQWNGSSGLDYSGWHLIFDPDATSNVNGPYGGGCVGNSTNHLSGCIVAARMTWASTGARWTIDKGSIPIFTSGWTSDQGGPDGDQPVPGSGNTVANIVGSTLTSVACPVGAPVLLTTSIPPTSTSATSCVSLTVDNLPYDNIVGTSSRALYQTTYQVGDYAYINSAMWCSGFAMDNSFCGLSGKPLLAIASVTPGTGTQYNLVLACINGNLCPTTTPTPTQLFLWRNALNAYAPWKTICCSGGSGDTIFWDWADDPHGMGTMYWNLSARNGHSWLLGGLYSGVSQSPDSVAPIPHYYNQDWRGQTASQFISNLTNPSGTNVTGVTSIQSIFNGVAGMQGQEYQSHPNFASIVTNPASPALGVDANPIGGTTNYPPNAQITQVGTSTYRLAATWVTGTLQLHQKILDTQAISGRFIMRNISAPGALITDGPGGYYTYCYVLIAGECWAGSTVGQIYFNTPYYVPTLNPANTNGGACLDGGFQQATAASNIFLLNDFCIFDSGTWNTHTRYNTAGRDFYGWARQTLGHLLLAGRAYIFSDIQGANTVKDSTDYQWYYTPIQFVGAGRFADILVKGPTFVPNSADAARLTFSPVEVDINVPTGANGAGVEIGYEDYGGYCSPNRAETCVTVNTSANMNLSTPWYWESSEASSITPVPCTHGTTCTVQAPVLWNHVARLTPVYYNGTTIVGRGPTQIVPIQ